MEHLRRTLAISACIAYAPLFAQAQTAAPDAWQFEFTPYLWAAGNIRGSYTGVLTTIIRRPLSRNWVTGYSPRNTSNPISFIT
jgi:hypothetical protein